MRQKPVATRTRRRRPLPPELPLYAGGGRYQLDIGADLYGAELRELLREAGLG